MTPQTAAKLTHIVAYLLFSIGIFWGLAAFPPFDFAARAYLDLLNWPMGDGRPEWNQEAIWLSSVGAGLVCALAVFYLFVVTPAVRNGDRRVVRATVLAALAWFVVDSAGSYAAGIPMNVLFNLVTLVPLIGPLLLVRFDCLSVDGRQSA